MRVLALGSCRVHDPLMAAEDAGEIDYLNRRFRRNRPVYLHDIHEAIQFARLVRGELVMPREIGLFAYERGLNVDRKMIDAFRRSDWVVVELCTDKHYEADGWTLNVNELYRHLVEHAGAAGHAWWDTIDRSETPTATLVHEVESELKARWRTRRVFGDGHRLMLSRLAFRYLTAQEMAKELAKLQSIVEGRILVVPHVAVRLPDGEPLKERWQHIEKTLEAARTVGLTCLDPRTFVVRDGQARAMADSGSDYNHYAASYVPVVGREIVQAIRAA